MEAIQQTIHRKIVELARALGRDAHGLRSGDDIPSSGCLDSPALMELIIWCETEFGIEIDQDQLTLDNFGTIEAMTAFIKGAQG